jgi:hypothetical protein
MKALRPCAGIGEESNAKRQAIGRSRAPRSGTSSPNAAVADRGILAERPTTKYNGASEAVVARYSAQSAV